VPDAVIHYTTDGRPPTDASPTYVAPIEIGTTTTVKAIAVRPGYDPSLAVSATYEIVSGGVVLTGAVTYSGRLIGTIATQEVAFWCRDEESGRAIDGLPTYYDPETSVYAIGPLASRRTGCEATLHVMGSRRTLPGNYNAFRVLDLRSVAPGSQQAFEFDAEKILHLVSPYDNSLIEMDTGEYGQEASPVHFAWEPLEEAVAYEVQLYNCSNPPDYSCLPPQRTTTAATVFDATLSSSAPGRHYEFSVVAWGASGREVGLYLTTYRDGFGWDYRFTVP
jgi:hypothetical protein